MARKDHQAQYFGKLDASGKSPDRRIKTQSPRGHFASRVNPISSSQHDFDPATRVAGPARSARCFATPTFKLPPKPAVNEND
jgi:hypothetical protein